LPVEAENIFDGAEVAGFVVVSGGIFDVVKVEFVFTGGCDGCAGVGTGALESLITIAVSVFLATERLDHRFEQYRLDVLLGNEPGKSGWRYRFVLVDANRESHVDCGVYGLPRGLDTRGDPFLTGVSCY
jgi:hypothetical protein